MMIHKVNPSVDNNQWLKRLNDQLNKPDVAKPTNKKGLL